jgi:ketosteroid isomerase-like protein
VNLAREDRAAIEEAIRDAAWQHLRAPDADTALGFYEPNAVVASDGRLYESFEAFAQDAREFYRTLREVHLAAWDEMLVDVLDDNAAVFTATVRWSSTDTAGVRTDLRGVWTAVWVRGASGWRLAARHESFAPMAPTPETTM